MSASTLPGLLLERAQTSPAKVVLRSHGLGIWSPTTWAELLARVERVGDGLASIGVMTGSVVAVIVGNRPEWLVTDLAVQGLGAATLPIDPDTSPKAIAAALRAVTLSAVVVADQEQFDKVVDAGIPAVPLVVCDSRGVRHLDDSRREDADHQMTFAQLESRGSTGAWRSAVGAVTPRTAAVVWASAGSVSTQDHASVLADGARLAAAVGLDGKDELFPHHTFANPVERGLSITGALAHGVSLSLGQDARLAALEAAAVQPTLVHASPKWADALAADLQRRIGETKGLKKVALARGFRMRPPATAARRPGFPPLRAVGLGTVAAVLVLFALTTSMNDWARIGLAILLAVAAAVGAVLTGVSVPAPLRRRLGLARARAIVVSDPISTAGSGTFGALGVPVVTVGTAGTGVPVTVRTAGASATHATQQVTT